MSTLVTAGIGPEATPSSVILLGLNPATAAGFTGVSPLLTLGLGASPSYIVLDGFSTNPNGVFLSVNDASSQPTGDVAPILLPAQLTVSGAGSQPTADVVSLVASTPLVVHDTESDAVTDRAVLTFHGSGALILGITDASGQPTGDVASLTYHTPPSLSVTGASSAIAADAAGLTYHPRLSLPIGDAASGSVGGISLLTAYDPSGSRVAPSDAASDAVGDVALLTFNEASDSADLLDAASDTHGDVVALTFALGFPLVQNPARTIVLTRPRDTSASWDFIEPDEEDGFTIDVSVDVPPNVAVTSVTWACSVASTMVGFTVDPSPQSRLIANPTITSGPMVGTGRTRWYVNQMFGNNPVPGNMYHLHIEAHTSDGRIIAGDGHVWCMAPN